MSNYEWEEGEIKLSTADFPKMRKAIAAFHNQHQDELFALAQRLHSQLAQGTREDRKQPLTDRLHQLMASQRVPEEDQYRISGTLIKVDPKAAKSRLKAPLRKEFQHAKSSTLCFGNGECSLSFEPKTRLVRWAVGENNHAVDRAWESALGKAFRSALKQVTWTRGTGGHFRYANEYMRDDDHEHSGGGSRISSRYGPLGDQTYEQQHGIRLKKRPPARR